jgi:hypothetical protein
MIGAIVTFVIGSIASAVGARLSASQ